MTVAHTPAAHSPDGWIGQRFELPGGASALFTGRSHGNMSSVGGDDCAHGAQARERLRELLGARSLARGYQVHGAAVHRVTAAAPDDESRARACARTDAADGQATALRGVAAMVLSADCLPVALGSEGAVAMVHAGWRGLAAGVLEQGVRAVLELAPGADVAAVIGPGAGVCCYEVGAEVHRAFDGTHSEGRHIDLRAIARERLLAAGVTRVHDARACTICDERFFSHRREGARAGRQAGVAWLS
jgi:polyphenol oxidase